MSSPDENAATETRTSSSETGYRIPEFLQRWDGLRRRVMSAAIIITLVVFAVTAGGIWFYTLVVLSALQMIREWDGIIPAYDKNKWKAVGLTYVGIPCIAFLWLRDVQFLELSSAGMRLTLYLIFVVAATDTAAYFAGRRIGGLKLAPSISPNKTWSGLVGGVVAAAVTGAICASFTPYPLSFSGCVWLAALLALVAQGGDLFESWLKRRAGVKDSGVLIPGHGGLLDRVDGMITAAPVFALMVAFSGLPR